MHRATLTAMLLIAAAAHGHAAETFLVKDRQPQAEIIIAAEPPRSTRLAAAELQTYLEKITGARLAVVTEPSGQVPVKIFVGRSPHTDRLKVTTEGLKDGAYRIVSGDDWLVLIGDDTDFVPIEPWARSNADIASGRMQDAWDKISGSQTGFPGGTLYKRYTGRADDFGKSPEQRIDKSGLIHVWDFDERGSFNAVCGFLRSLGVRWYMPGEIGEVVPTHTTIALPRIDETVRPDFAIRRFNINFGFHDRDTVMWAMRLGIRNPHGVQITHGMHTMTHREELFRNHPEWYALYGGQRQTQPGQRLNQLCYSNEELFRETVRYARAQFDHYKIDVVSVMPPDGYTAICQCPLCKGKDTPERDYRGRLSDYVWDFVNRVAKEVAKTHPGKMVSNCAYGTYTLPPTKIEKLEPNVLVCIVGGRRPTASTPEQQEELRKLREAWAAKTANPIMIFENYPFTDRGWYMPSYVPRVIGSSINATKGMSQGEDIWLSAGRDFKTVGIGFNHFQVYFTARMYWGGKNQDVEAILDEYCRLFYGPAGPEMKAFFDYCEANWQQMNKDKERVDRALALFAAAEAKTTAETVYGKRIALVGAFLEALKNKSEQLARQRGPVPQLRLARDASGIVIDGDLNDKFWKNAPSHATGQLRELQTGRTPTYGTRFQAAWGTDGHLYLAIRCQDRKGEKLKIGTTRNGDQALWYGDAIEILLETEAHSYYQIAVSPSGAIVNLDRGADKSSWFRWDSQAEVATRIGEDHWTVEIRIPVTTDSNDPLHQVIGRKPSSSLPWHFNICRQRIRDTGQELSAFSPTGKANFHDPMKFAHLFEGKSHQFDHAPATADYLEGRRAALALLAKGKRAEALTAFTTLADGKLTPFQKADALEQAAACARLLQQPDRALALAEQIPEKAAAKLVRMQNLLAQRQPKELVEQFGSDDINQWPFWLAGDAYFARGRAFADTGAGREAEADFLQALEVTPGSRLRPDIWLALGLNREQTLKDDTAALEAYQEVTRSNARGSATYFRGVQSAARVFSRKGQHDEAVKLLKPQTTDTPRGFWRGSMWLALADAYKAAGRKAEAQELYQQLLKDDQVEPTHRKAAEAALKKASQPE